MNIPIDGHLSYYVWIVVLFVVLLSIAVPRNAAPPKKKKKVSASADSSILIFNITYPVPVFLFLEANSLRISSLV